MRVKHSTSIKARHRRVRASTKGYTKAHRSSVRRGKQATTRALVYAYRDRRTRKRTFRQLWNARINAAAHTYGTSYSRLMGGLKTEGIIIDRKVLAEMAVSETKAFKALVDKVTK